MLELEVKNLIIGLLHIEDVTAADIDSAAPLFGDGLGLDSIDMLELSIALEDKYGIVLPPDTSDTHDHFASVYALTAMIEMRRTK